MRLTEKRNNEIGYSYKEYSSESSAAITKKLGQLEDIEEELAEKLDIKDFNLILVLTFIIKGGYYKDCEGKIKKARYISFDFEDGTFSCHYRNGCAFKEYEDIGKEIALTKEELE